MTLRFSWLGDSWNGPANEAEAHVPKADTTVDSSNVLFAGAGSVPAAVTDAVLLITVLLVGVTTIVTVALAPFASEPSAHVIVAVPLQEPVEGVAETSVTDAGSVSVTVTVVAVSGPLLVTVTV